MNPFDFSRQYGHCQDFPDCWNCSFCDSNTWIEFWVKVEAEWAEQEKQRIIYEMEMGYYSDEEDEPEYDTCDYTGEVCIGNKMFCEECSVLTDEVQFQSSEKANDKK